MVVLDPGAARAGEAVWPSSVEEVLPTGVLVLESLRELQQVAALLVSCVSHVRCPPDFMLPGGCDKILCVPEQAGESFMLKRIHQSHMSFLQPD